MLNLTGMSPLWVKVKQDYDIEGVKREKKDMEIPHLGRQDKKAHGEGPVFEFVWMRCDRCVCVEASGRYCSIIPSGHVGKGQIFLFVPFCEVSTSVNLFLSSLHIL